MTTVATQLPMRLPSARAMPTNQSIDSSKTSPIAGIAGTALSVARRMTMAEPGMPCAPLQVISEIASTKRDRRATAACWSLAR